MLFHKRLKQILVPELLTKSKIIKLRGVKYIFFSMVLAILFFNGSCNKNRINAGEHIGIFTYSNPQGLVKTASFEVSNPTEKTIKINGFEIKKDGEIIEGKIGSLGNMTDVFISGKLTHRVFSKENKIIGNFTERYHQGGNEYQNSGTFEIKSN
jgi:hypothetical protein